MMAALYLTISIFLLKESSLGFTKDLPIVSKLFLNRVKAYLFIKPIILLLSLNLLTAQPAFNCSKLITETPEKCVKYVHQS